MLGSSYNIMIIMPDVEHARAMHGSIELLVLPLTSALTAAEA